MDKLKLTFWITEDTNNLINAYYPIDDCSTRSVFVEKAIRFYSGYLAANKTQDYLATAVNQSVSRALSNFENRMSKLLFKYSVEEAIMMNVIAALHKIDKSQLDIIRGQCVEEIKKTRGSFSLSDAMKWQGGE